jgi:hypothetical protein
VARREGGGFGRLARTEVIVPLLRGLILGFIGLIGCCDPRPEIIWRSVRRQRGDRPPAIW